MIRLLYAITRKADMSFAEFQSFWLEQHGPMLISAAPELAIKRCIQFHSLSDPSEAKPDMYRGEMQEPFDGVLELWFDTLDDALASLNKDAAKNILEHERQFVDHENSTGWIAYDCPQVNPTPENVIAAPDSGVVKLFYALGQPEGTKLEDIQWYWRVQHGPLVRSVATDIQALRYIQVHRLEHDFNELFAKQRGTKAPYYGHAELWFDTTREPMAGAQDAARLLYEDETRFIDFAHSASWVGKEHVLVSA